jgi:hypothetical protein
LFEGGEHGQFAARLAAQVIYMYTQKKRARDGQHPNSAQAAPVPSVPSPKPAANSTTTPATKPAAPSAAGEMTGIWTDGSDHLQAGRFRLNRLPAVVVPLTAAPGLDAIKSRESQH